MILLDTHVLVWLNEGDKRLGAAARKRLLDLPEGSVFLSAITFWEIALLVRKGRLALDRPLDLWFDQAVELSTAMVAPVTREVAVASVRLPEPFHADPADRFIVATARSLDLAVMTADKAILSYGHSGHIDAVDAAF